jgi:hypothetical protein
MGEIESGAEPGLFAECSAHRFHVVGHGLSPVICVHAGFVGIPRAHFTRTKCSSGA